jgi:hypothetical protein
MKISTKFDKGQKLWSISKTDDKWEVTGRGQIYEIQFEVTVEYSHRYYHLQSSDGDRFGVLEDCLFLNAEEAYEQCDFRNQVNAIAPATF